MPSGRPEWIAMAKAVYGRFGEVQVTDRAAAQTYYSILSLFPGLLVVVSLLALVGNYPEHLREHRQHAARRGSGDRRRHDRQRAARRALESRATPGILLIVGILLSLLLGLGRDGGGDALAGGDQPGEQGAGLPPEPRRSARADRPRHGPRPVSFLAVVIAGPLFGSIADAAGFPRVRQGPGRLPALADRRRRPCSPRSRSSTRSGRRRTPAARATAPCARCCPGAIVGTALWFAVSLLFTAYVSHFGSYDKTYGTLGAVISLLIWLWLGNLAFLLGALFNAEGYRAVDKA